MKPPEEGQEAAWRDVPAHDTSSGGLLSYGADSPTVANDDKAAGRGEAERAEEIRVAVRALLAGASEGENNPWTEPYDVIRVSKAGLVYVLGAVGRPGGYPIEQESMTVLRALSLAQGLDGRASPQKARVIRQSKDGSQEIAIRIGDILRGAAADALLENNDILFVPDSRAKGALHRGAEAAIQLATGVIIWRR
jgi:polysaccharide export outer membrane protein